ncbi:MAG: tRNA nucleotidyltransferase [Oscillospiraceae bacterium]|nr:tRNA nucleotidyltransferase [Oscillospiraceae bacterium]
MSDYEKEERLCGRIAQRVAEKGGTAYYVGGWVRDRLMGIPNKDVDMEVHGIAPAVLREILEGFGERITVGESFGVYTLKGYSIDIAMPRRETVRGLGHRDFDICVDPFAGTRAAAMRRDFTVNALMQNVLTGEIVDAFGGRDDLRQGILRHVSDASFAEDALRVLRGAQFAARFGFSVAPETAALCRKMSLRHLARERVMDEVKKALCKADKPSVFFTFLRDVDKLGDWFPELQALIGVEQPPEHHAEGDVWTHTMMVLDAAASFRDRVREPLAFMLSALCHDFGKAVCTEKIGGVIHALGHETSGLPLAEAFVRRLTDAHLPMQYVRNLTEYHMKPNKMAADGASIKATNRLFDASVDPEALVYLALADGLGKLPQTTASEAFLHERLELFKEYMKRPYVMGRDLIEAGLAPSPMFSAVLAYAHKLRLAGVDKQNALKQTLAYAKQLEKRGGA